MAQAVNCKKCGALFLKTSKYDICNKCLDEQNKMVNDINSFVITSPEESFSVEFLLKKYNITRNEFEELYSAGKFVRIVKKVTMVCTNCGNVVSIENKTGTLCSACARKLQNQI